MKIDNPRNMPTEDLYSDYETYHYCWFPTRSHTPTPSLSTKTHWTWLKWTIRIETINGKMFYEDIQDPNNLPELIPIPKTQNEKRL